MSGWPGQGPYRPQGQHLQLESLYLTLSQGWRAREQLCLVHTETFNGSLFLQNLSLPPDYPLKWNRRTPAQQLPSSPHGGKSHKAELSHCPAQDGHEGEGSESQTLR